MQWFEYDKAEEQLEALSGSLEEARKDLVAYQDVLSPISITAIKNEIRRLDMYRKDIQEVMQRGNLDN